MSTKHNDGGPAFPEIETTFKGVWHPDVHSKGGMTLRDWFAGQALLGRLSAHESCGDYADFARASYAYADAMLAARATGAE